MEIGLIGLGRMGAGIAARLLRAGHACVVHDTDVPAIDRMVERGAQGAFSLDKMVAALARPRVIWLMVPAAGVDASLSALLPLLSRDDTVIDGGNSYYRDDLRRAEQSRAVGVRYVDVGTSGGVAGDELGYCLMIGGETDTVRRLEPIFTSLAPGVFKGDATAGTSQGHGTAEQGYLHCGPHGAGHFVKMVHNGIEYGIMAAYAEGMNILHNANAGERRRGTDAETAPMRGPEFYQYEMDLLKIAEVWRRGSVISSRLLDLIAVALTADPVLEGFGGVVADSGEGRWTIQAAIDESVPTPVLSAALYSRFSSRGESDFANRLLSAMRKEFGGHVEVAAT